jgi:predicted DNA-binding transcriptional regulator YafY
LRHTGEHFEPQDTAFESGEVYNPDPADPRVTLRLAPAAAWVAEAHPTLSVTERPGGELDVVLTVSEPAWLDRLLLRLGPDAEVIDPPDRRDAGAAVAKRVLARYTDDSGRRPSGRMKDRERTPTTVPTDRSGTSETRRT